MHDLDELCKLCINYSDSFNNIADNCSDLTTYGVQPRYPMELTLDEDDMKQALDGAKEVKNFIVFIIKEKIKEDKKKTKAEETK